MYGAMILKIWQTHCSDAHILIVKETYQQYGHQEGVEHGHQAIHRL